MLGKGQLSLAKFLIIVAGEDNPNLDIHDIPAYFQHVLQRIDWTRDLHFHTNTSIDTLDCSGTGLNQGSKVVFAAAGEVKRELSKEIAPEITVPDGFSGVSAVMPGVLAITGPEYGDPEAVKRLTAHLGNLPTDLLKGWPLIVLCDDGPFCAAHLNNFLWVAFTRCNPSHDIHGVNEFTEHKHWGCRGSLVIDARIKPHHAPLLIPDPEVEKRVDALGAKGGSLHGII